MFSTIAMVSRYEKQRKNLNNTKLFDFLASVLKDFKIISCLLMFIRFISAWIITCVAFVFGAFMEYGFILFYKQTAFDACCPLFISQKTLNHVDCIFLFLFSLGFFVFNFFFWYVAVF